MKKNYKDGYNGHGSYAALPESTKQARARHNARYNKANIHRVVLNLNLNTDGDILIELASKKSIAGYIKELIRKDIAEHQEEQP